MIGLGANYLTAAGFGRYSITAASLGSLDILGTVSGWLSKQARQAIMAAFGVDGTAVIAATNEYLNGIAASDKAKATALAGFINTYEAEDPHMIYSIVPTLGVTRWIANGGTAWINLGFTPNQTLSVEVGYKSHRVEAGIFGASNSWSGNSAFVGDYYGSNGSIYCFYNGALGLAFTGGEGIIKADKDTLQVGSLTGNIGGIIRGIGANMSVFRGGGKTCNGEISYMKIGGDTEMILYPFIRNNVNGMLDLIGGTFYANAGSGSFTISETPTP